MTTHPSDQHLDERDLSAAVAGLDLEDAARHHLAACLTCRRRVDAAAGLIQTRRDLQRTDEPDWHAQHRSIMVRLPAAAPEAPAERQNEPTTILAWPARLLSQRSAHRSLLAAAAALIVAAGLLALTRPWLPVRAPTITAAEVPVEDILAEVDAMLAEDQLPGFEPLDPIVPDLEEIQAHYTHNGAS